MHPQSPAPVSAGQTSPSPPLTTSGNHPTIWQMMPDALTYLAAFSIFPMIILGVVKGGLWVSCPFWSIITLLDLIAGDSKRNYDVATPHRALFFHSLLTWIWVPLLPVTYGVVFWQMFHFDHLNLIERISIVFALGTATSLSISVGHELAHRRSTWERRLSEFLLSFPALGHYWTEHISVHHAHVATPRDPATARKGENVYRFVLRAFVGSFVSSWRVERERQLRRRRTMWHWSNPFWRRGLILAVLVGLAAAIGGWGGIAAYVGAALVANFSLRVVDYFEHYGLLRLYLGKGRFERTAPRHAWNCASRVSSHVVFNVQRHSDHHYRPTRPFPLLQTHTTNEAASLPWNYVIMYVIALIPPLWRKVMHPRLEDWRRRFYPQVEDWTPYDSPLYHRYPEKFPIIAEVVKDARLAAWAHAHPAVLEGRHAPEMSHLVLAEEDLDEEVAAIAQKGLVTLFYRKELTADEMESQLGELTREVVDISDAVQEIRPWLEDRAFQLQVHAVSGHLTPKDECTAFSMMMDAVILHLASKIDDEFSVDSGEGGCPFPPPELHVLGSLARSEMVAGEMLRLTVGRGDEEGTGSAESRFRREWKRKFLKGMQQLLPDDFPCTLSTSLAAPGTSTDEAVSSRRLR